jgi:outer membrane autotransporter protein
VATATGDMAVVINAVDNLSAAAAPRFFDEASPEFYGAFATSMQDQANLFTAQIDGRLNTRADDGKAALWINFYGQSGKGKSRGDRFGTDRDLWGIAGGADIASGGFTGGLAVGYSSADLDYRLGNAKGNSDSWQIAAYGAFTAGQVDVRAKAGYVGGNFDATRTVAAGTLVRTATANFDGDLFLFSAEAGYNLGSEDWKIRPFAGIDILSGRVKSFNETGADALSLEVGRIKADSTRIAGGLEVSGKSGDFTPYGRAAYRHEVGSNNRSISAAFAGSPALTGFTIEGLRPGKSSVDLEVGGQYKLSERASAFLGYQGRLRNDINSHGGNIGVRFSF